MNGELLLEGLPFAAGQSVEVFVLAKDTGTLRTPGRDLQGSVLAYHEPSEPIVSEDWDALPQ